MYQISELLNSILYDEFKHGNVIDRVINNYSTSIDVAIFMKKKISKENYLKYFSENKSGIRCWTYNGSPQNNPDQGILDEHNRQAIVFPCE